MCFHNIAEQLEGDGQLERAEIWYRRAIACCLEAYGVQTEAHAAANWQLGGECCPRKLERRAERRLFTLLAALAGVPPKDRPAVGLVAGVSIDV